MFQKTMLPPNAAKKSKTLTKHGDVRIDNYFWMNERDSDEVIDYLTKENDYYKSVTDKTKDFQEKLFLEMKGRIKEDDESVPYKLNGYWYITRYEEGKDYPIYLRKKRYLNCT
jgi:oligopeptidase B